MWNFNVHDTKQTGSNTSLDYDKAKIKENIVSLVCNKWQTAEQRSMAPLIVLCGCCATNIETNFSYSTEWHSTITCSHTRPSLLHPTAQLDGIWTRLHWYMNSREFKPTQIPIAEAVKMPAACQDSRLSLQVTDYDTSCTDQQHERLQIPLKGTSHTGSGSREQHNTSSPPIGLLANLHVLQGCPRIDSRYYY